MRSSRGVRAEVAAVARELHARGWVANHDGNVTARDGSILVATPTATSKRRVTEATLVEVDRAGKPLGSGKVFGEIGLHAAIYDRRPDVHAVVHAHPPAATAIACSAPNPIERPFIAEAVVSLGPIVPRVSFAAPGAAAVAALAPWCELVDVALLANHGVIAWGADLEQALLRLELVEHLARIALAAAPLGGPVALPADALAALHAARAKAGLGRAGDRAVEIAAKFAQGITTPARPVAACAPAPHAHVPVVALGRRSETSDLAAIVRDEVVRALRGT
jgi:L-fuculose-phosphate aldolase